MRRISLILKILLAAAIAAVALHILFQNIPVKGIFDTESMGIGEIKADEATGAVNSDIIPDSDVKDSSGPDKNEYEKHLENNQNSQDKLSNTVEGYDIPDYKDIYGEDFHKDGRLFMSSEEVEAVECLSFKDKVTGISILSKVGKNDMEKIYDVVEDGVTNEEMGKIRSLLEKYLSESEVDTLYKMLWKTKLLYQEKNR